MRTLTEMLDGARLAALAAAPPLVPPSGDPAWDAVGAVARADLLRDADALLTDPAPPPRLRDWLGFTRTGNRMRFEDRFFARRRETVAAALALALGDDGRLDDLQDRVWDLLHEPTWCVPAHHSGPDGTDVALPRADLHVLDLFAAETGALLGWVLALHGHRLEPGLPELIRERVTTRILDPFGADATRYHWFAAPTNWNPWVVSNVIAAALTVRPPGIADVLRLAATSLDAYLAGVPADGGCPEGVGYWWQSAARCFDALDLLARAGLGPGVFALAPLAAMARYPLAAHLGGPAGSPWNAVFADGWARIPDAGGWVREAHSAALLHRYGRAVGDAEVVAFAAGQRGDGPAVPLPTSLWRGVAALLDPTWPPPAADRTPVPASTWLPDTQVRSVGTAVRLVLKGGHNDEPHNHNDVGSFVVGVRGVPVLVDAGSGEYTRDTFRAGRYAAWHTRSDHHSVPEVDGVGQAAGAGFAARVLEVPPDGLVLDLAGAYPGLAGHLIRAAHAVGPVVSVTDTWELERDPREIVLRYLLAHEPDPIPGGWALRGPDGGPVLATLRAHVRDAVVRRVGTGADAQLSANWGDHLALLELRPAPTRSGAVTVTVTAA